MASVSYRGGRGVIQFIGLDGRRRSIRFGRCTRKQIEVARGHIEQLEGAKSTGGAMEAITAVWVAELPQVIRRRVERVGLIQPKERPECPTLARWCQAYIDHRTDVAPAMLLKLKQTRDKLVECMGGSRRLDEITGGDAKDFEVYMKARNASEAYRRRVCGLAKSFFAYAVDKEIILRNPFTVAKIKTGNKANKDRERFIDVKTSQAVMDHCPDDELRLIFALARWGGLRVVSEILAFMWEDVLWDKQRFIVHSIKTAHFAGKETRLVPLFPEIVGLLLDAFDKAEPGTVYVINKYRVDNANQILRKLFLKILKRAGVPIWPRLFQNLRSSRETELAETFPLAVVCEWIGNSPEVAQAHYIQKAQEVHFEKAVQGALQNPVQFPVQPGAATDCTERKGGVSDPQETPVKQGDFDTMQKETAPCENHTEPYLVGADGFEPS